MEAIENKYRERDYEVNIRFPEFTCLCPMTAQPDFAEIMITYVPGDCIVELKSLKLYLNSYRDKGIFHEEAVNRILSDFVEKICPKKVEVIGAFNVRGGIHTTVTARYPDPKG
ncbi:MAG TPA: preQ(1) synthase [Syntrophales bacterium]|nr:preQ(1) synthase [Syntrophales bacterium]HPQ43287.1 preQ(1) synthase [Syntrophales bacterium]